jgi:PadR family transcriptional regulator PadR
MRRKPGTLLPIELSLLAAAAALLASGTREFHGFLIAACLRERARARSLTGYGTLYKALERLERAGLLVSRWEDPEIGGRERRPRRRLYRITAEGLEAVARVPAVQAGGAATLRKGTAPA